MTLGTDLFFSLFNNLAIFIALVAIYGYLNGQLKQTEPYTRQMYLGVAFGIFAVGCMYARISVYEGVIVDQRNAIIALSGVFGGPLAAYMSAALAGTFRLYLGGQGAFAGVIGVLLAAASGVILSKRNAPFGSLSSAVTSAFLATLFILPGFLFVKNLKIGLALLMSMAVPYGLAIFLGILSVGLLLQREDNKIKLEQLLRESEERFQKMFRDHNAIMLLINADSGKIIDANKAAVSYYGYTRQEIISMPVEKINTRPPQETRAALNSAKNRQGNYFEFKHRLASGEIRDIEAYSSPIVINGSPLLFSVIHDTTERKQAEKELANYRDHLEVLVDDQTRKLKQAQAELLQRERLVTLGEVTATVSHELRNPLGTIQMALFSIENSLERQKPELAGRALELADRSIKRCVNIIEELNSFTRVKNLAVTEASLDDWIRSVIEEQSFAEEISCELDLASGVRAFFDPEKLRQVLVNLIDNAVHALMGEAAQERRLRISSKRIGDQYEIRVQDNGFGMSAEVQAKIFDPLYSTKIFGVGLGMVIVKSIVDKHQGEITVESQPGAGTSIAIRLPITLPAEAKAKAAHTQAGP